MTGQRRCQRCTYIADDLDDLLRHQSEIHDPPGVRKRAGSPAAPKAGKRTPISEAGKQADGSLACPKCGGAQFKVKRSGGRKLGALVAAPVTLFASAAVLAKGTQVKCVTCGAVYKRG